MDDGRNGDDGSDDNSGGSYADADASSGFGKVALVPLGSQQLLAVAAAVCLLCAGEAGQRSLAPVWGCGLKL